MKGEREDEALEDKREPVRKKICDIISRRRGDGEVFTRPGESIQLRFTGIIYD